MLGDVHEFETVTGLQTFPVVSSCLFTMFSDIAFTLWHLDFHLCSAVIESPSYRALRELSCHLRVNFRLGLLFS